MIRTIQITFLIVYALAIGGLMGFIVVQNGEKYVSSTKIKVFRNTKGGFLNEDELMASIKTQQNVDSIKLKNLRTSLIEDVIYTNPYIESVDAFTNIDGELRVNFSEKMPVLRIFNKRAEGYYICKNGDIIPLSTKYSARVFMVNGYLNIPFVEGNTNIYDTLYRKTSLSGILKLVNTLNKDEFLKSQINQIYLNSKQEFELIPEFGKHVIIVGDLVNLDNKMKKLKAFYQQVLLEEGLEKYNTINLKFDGQLVCTKN